jgi:hypothetical protein
MLNRISHRQQRAAVLAEAFMTLSVKLEFAEPDVLDLAKRFLDEHDGEESAKLLQTFSDLLAEGK